MSRRTDRSLSRSFLIVCLLGAALALPAVAGTAPDASPQGAQPTLGPPGRPHLVFPEAERVPGAAAPQTAARSAPVPASLLRALEVDREVRDANEPAGRPAPPAQVRR